MKQARIGKPRPPLPEILACPKCSGAADVGSNPARVYCQSWACGFSGPARQRMLEAVTAWNELNRSSQQVTR